MIIMISRKKLGGYRIMNNTVFSKYLHFLNNFLLFLGNSAKKQSLIFEAVDYGLKAIEIDELNSEAHKWYAIVIFIYF